MRVWSHEAGRRENFGARVRARLGLVVDVAPTLEAATAGAAIVTVVTRARDPFLGAFSTTSPSALTSTPSAPSYRTTPSLRPGVLPAADVIATERGERPARVARVPRALR